MQVYNRIFWKYVRNLYNSNYRDRKCTMFELILLFFFYLTYSYYVLHFLLFYFHVEF